MNLPAAIDRHEVVVHGHVLSYLTGGPTPASGQPTEGPAPVVVVLHGIGRDAISWSPVLARLAATATVIAPDLPGHGESDKGFYDASIGGYANAVRDLMLALQVPKATLVGHSLGGGISLQLSYQYPDRVERLVLVSSGGLGREVHLALRAATLPGAELVLPLIFHPRVRAAGEKLARGYAKIPYRPAVRPGVTEILNSVAALSDRATHRAFIRTARSVIDVRGQKVGALDKLYLAAGVPVLVVWGAKDQIIPAGHAAAVTAAVPSARCVVFPKSGHFPQLDDPGRFVSELTTFLRTTEPAVLDAERVTALLAATPDPDDQL